MKLGQIAPEQRDQHLQMHVLNSCWKLSSLNAAVHGLEYIAMPKRTADTLTEEQQNQRANFLAMNRKFVTLMLEDELERLEKFLAQLRAYRRGELDEEAEIEGMR